MLQIMTNGLLAHAEGNVAGIRILAEAGANLTLPARIGGAWGNTVEDEARRSNAQSSLHFWNSV